MVHLKKKIPSEMEEAPPDKLLSLLTLITLLTLLKNMRPYMPHMHNWVRQKNATA